ncbi:uncharacterized protein LOC121834502 [Ixodes scapularis]|uniref:uncharacterized protein LOC121834502 n=1 Tax=Ixodes scapularis TaxID=6945 RepID=UPI001C388096|nr:uncharacterized protein LOC121834502 [Ixodes scapularis]
MDLDSLLKLELLAVAEELGLDESKAMRKPDIVKTILGCGAGDDEIAEAVDEAKKRRLEEERDEQLKQQQLEQLKLTLEMTAVGVAKAVNYDMRSFLQPFSVGSELGFFLTNFERTCVRMDFEESSWRQRLLSVLPAEAADVLARLLPEETENYAVVKGALLRKYKLSPEAFRLKFQEATKGPQESYSEFAYKLGSFLENWLKGARAYEDKAKMFEQFCLEQFYRTLPEKLREWFQDRPDVGTVRKAAEYADEYCAKRGSSCDLGKTDRPPGASFGGTKGWRSSEKNANKPVPKDESPETRMKKSFEARKQIVCFRCQKPGHVAAGCRVPKVSPVQLVLEKDEDVLGPYLYDMDVNGKTCKVLRDTGATYGVVHTLLS